MIPALQPWRKPRHGGVRHFGVMTGDRFDRGTWRNWEESMAAKKKKKAAKKGGDLIISKSRTKAATKKCNVGGEFYGALDAVVRKLIADAEGRALGNKRKTLKAVDL